MSALLSRLRKRVPLHEVLYFLLIYLSMHSVLLGVELVVRGTSGAVLRAIIVLAILVGWLLSRSRLGFWPALAIALLSGFLLTVLRVGGMGAALWNLLGGGIEYAWKWVFHRVSDPSRLTILTAVLQSRSVESLASLSRWFTDLISGFTVYDQISTLLSWGWILWIFSCWFAWTTYRREQPVWGVLPAGTMLSILMTYTLEKRFSVVVLLGAGLILIGIVNQEIRQRAWKKVGLKGTDAIRQRVYIAVVGFALYTVAFAGLMPSIRIKPIADRFEKLVYGSEEAQDGDGAGSSIEVGGFNTELYSIERVAGLPRQKLVGSGPELAKRVVMIVNYPASAFVESELPHAARYWRSYTYDRYTGSGWQSSPTTEVRYQPGQEIARGGTEAVEIITQEFRLSNSVRGTLFSAGPPLTIDHAVLVSWRAGARDDGLPGGGEDIFAVAFDALVYQVRSMVATARDDQLRLSAGEYPAWLRERYLELPESVPQRVRDLAQEVTSGQPTRYDQAKAIESFLRSYPYTLELPAPPLDRDVADYFLFDLQTGYCDYYATSMVVLARAVGLPARLVVGYVGGLYDPENDYYLVSEADAHSWVEVYFNDYGWIPFEPTAARNLIDEEAQALPLPPELTELPQAAEPGSERQFRYWQIVPALLLALVLGGIFWSRADLMRLERMDPTNLALVISQRLYRYGRWLEVGQRKSDTPFEFRNKLLQRMAQPAGKARLGKMLAGCEGEITQLTEAAVQAQFSPRSLSGRRSPGLVQVWVSLRSKLRRLVWRSWLRTLVNWLAFWDTDKDSSKS